MEFEPGAITNVDGTVYRFPSPCGVMEFELYSTIHVTQLNDMVSVPLRGNGI